MRANVKTTRYSTHTQRAQRITDLNKLCSRFSPFLSLETFNGIKVEKIYRKFVHTHTQPVELFRRPSFARLSGVLAARANACTPTHNTVNIFFAFMYSIFSRRKRYEKKNFRLQFFLKVTLD